MGLFIHVLNSVSNFFFLAYKIEKQCVIPECGSDSYNEQMSTAFLISKDFNQISAEQKSENFELCRKIFNISIYTSTAWQINNS